MKKIERVITTTITYFVDDKCGFEVPINDLLECLEDLDNCDGIFNKMEFYNSKMQNYLFDKGIIKDAKGTTGCKDNNLRKELLNVVYKLIYD